MSESINNKLEAEKNNQSINNNKNSEIVKQEKSIKQYVDNTLSSSESNSEKLSENKICSKKFFLLRHYPCEHTLTDKEYIRYKQLSDEKLIRDLEEYERIELKGLDLKRNIKKDNTKFSEELNLNLESIFNNTNKDKLLIIYDGSVDAPIRMKQTAEKLHDDYGILESNIINTLDLKGGNKMLPSGTGLNISGWDFENAIKVIKENYGNNSMYENIIIIGNRSYAHAFQTHICNMKKGSISNHIDEFVEKGYYSTSWDKSLNLIRDESLLEITPSNIEGIVIDLENMYGEDFFDSVDKNSFIQIQNFINEYFLNNKSYIDILINKSINNNDLHIFGLQNLLKEKNKYANNISLFLKGVFFKKTEGEVIEIFNVLSDYNNTDFFNEFIYNIRKNNVGEKYLKIKEYENIMQISEDNVKNIFSFDNKVESGDVIERSFYMHQKKSKNEIEILKKNSSGKVSEREMYKNQKIDLESLIGGDKKIIVLEGNPGEGKSIQLRALKQKIEVEYKNHIPLFYTKNYLKGNKNIDIIKKDIISNIDIIKLVFPNKNIILFFDGIDELKKIHKEPLKKFLSKIIAQKYEGLTCILGTRKGEFCEYGNKDYHTLSFGKFTAMQFDEFIGKRVEDTKHIEVINEFLSKNILDETLKYTPLILYFLTELSINEIKEIKNRSGLYEKMYRKILKDRYETKQDVDFSDNNINLEGDFYSDVAYKIFHNISNVENENKVLLSSNLEGGEQSFIHPTFQEFFLAKYFSQKDKGCKEIFKERDNNTKNWNQWRKFNSVVQFYGENLINSGKYKKLKELLLGLFNKDNIFGEGFFIGLELLWKAKQFGDDNKILIDCEKIYLSEIDKLSKSNILYYIHGFQKFQKNIGYAQKGFAEKYYNKLLKIYNKNEKINKKSESKFQEEINKSFEIKKEKTQFKYELDKLGLIEHIKGENFPEFTSFIDYETYKKRVINYVDILYLGDKKSLGLLYEWEKELYSNLDYKSLIIIYERLIEKGNYYVFESLFDILEKIYNSYDDNTFSRGYKSFYENINFKNLIDIFLSLGNEDIINQIKNFGEEKLNNFNGKNQINTLYVIFSKLHEILGNSVDEFYIKLIPLLKESGFYYEVVSIYIDLGVDKYESELDKYLDYIFEKIDLENFDQDHLKYNAFFERLYYNKLEFLNDNLKSKLTNYARLANGIHSSKSVFESNPNNINVLLFNESLKPKLWKTYNNYNESIGDIFGENFELMKHIQFFIYNKKENKDIGLLWIKNYLNKEIDGDLARVFGILSVTQDKKIGKLIYKYLKKFPIKDLDEKLAIYIDLVSYCSNDILKKMVNELYYIEDNINIDGYLEFINLVSLRNLKILKPKKS